MLMNDVRSKNLHILNKIIILCVFYSSYKIYRYKNILYSNNNNNNNVKDKSDFEIKVLIR